MKVVALISGGKDSCFNMVLCQQHGHQIVALGNLLPATDQSHDIDSYTFQTVGHRLISTYAECMNLPLYRIRTQGRSNNQKLVYEDTAGDEVEDLYRLLAYVKQQMPDIEAVSTGAIASDYQRTRVERVCSRLGLVSLAYMWRQPQSLLLTQMVNAGIHAILIKVAAAGLIPEKHLGASLQTMQPQLQKLRSIFGLNVCGEGGEYETLTLDCPLFTNGRIVLDESEIEYISKDSMAPVALLNPTKFHVELKDDQGDGSASSQGIVIEVPETFLAGEEEEEAETVATDSSSSNSRLELETTTSIAASTRYVSIGCHVSVINAAVVDVNQPETTQQAVSDALSAIGQEIEKRGITWKNSLFVHLYVPSMACFGAANAAYAQFLPSISPPARATVQLAAATDSTAVCLVAEVLCCCSRAHNPTTETVEEEKQVLHVQSISSWAPSCIGPYAQAVRHGSLVLFAGQIALDPASMVIIETSVAAQCRLCVKSLDAVAVAMRLDLTRSMAWCTIYCSDGVDAGELASVEQQLESYIAGKSMLGSESLLNKESDDDDDDDDDGDGTIDEYLLPPDTVQRLKPQLTFIRVPQLPRGALVEIQPVGFIEPGECEISSSSGSDDGQAPKTTTSRGPVYEYKTVDGLQVAIHKTPHERIRLQVWHPLEDSSGSVGAEELTSVLYRVLEIADAEVADAGLSISDNIVLAKMYCPSVLWPALHEARAAVDDDGSSLSVKSFTCVSVTSVGHDASSKASLFVELYASS